VTENVNLFSSSEVPGRAKLGLKCPICPKPQSGFFTNGICHTWMELTIESLLSLCCTFAKIHILSHQPVKATFKNKQCEVLNIVTQSFFSTVFREQYDVKPNVSNNISCLAENIFHL